MRGFRPAACVLAAMLFGAVVLGRDTLSARQNGPAWGLAGGVIPATADLYGVYMQDANTAWIAGSESGSNPGRVYKIVWRNGQWTLGSVSSFRIGVRAIVAVSNDNVWAVGNGAMVLHKVGDTWQEVTDPGINSTVELTSIQVLGSGEEAWIGGFQPLMQGTTGVVGHLTKGKLDTLTTTGAGVVTGLHFAPGGGWIVGTDLIWRYNGEKWANEALPACPAGLFSCTQFLTGVRAISSEEAWASGTREYVCNAPCPPRAAVFHRTGGTWQEVLPAGGVEGEPQAWGTELYALSFSNDGVGMAVGDYRTTYITQSLPYIISYRPGGKWRYEDTPPIVGGQLNAVSQFDSAHAIAVGNSGVVLSYGYGPGSVLPTPVPTATPVPLPTRLPSEPVSDPKNPLVRYFPLVGHTLRGGFRDYWQAHGGLEQFGYPTTEEFEEVSPTDGKTYVTQYFERARFEWHPENRPPYDILLGLLGRTVIRGRESETPFQRAAAQAGPGIMYFEATGHNMPPQFSTYWQTHGGLPVYGYPISEAFTEKSPTDGKPYLVQYFERNRLEYHPELPEPYRVSLGLLGVQILQQRGWIGTR